MSATRPAAVVTVLVATFLVIGAAVVWGTYPGDVPETQVRAAAAHDAPSTTEMAPPESGQAALASPAEAAGPGHATAGAGRTCEPSRPAGSAPSGEPGCTEPAPPAVQTPSPQHMGCAETPPTQTAIVEGQGGKKITVSMRGCDAPIQSDDQSVASGAPASVCEETGPIHTSWGVAVARTGRIIPLGVGTGSCRPAHPGEPIPTPRPTPAPGPG